MTVQTAVEAIDLEKSQGDVRVLDGVDLRVARGSVFALPGPNGAGKTTTVKILSTLVTANRGRAWVAGYDVAIDRDVPDQRSRPRPTPFLFARSPLELQRVPTNQSWDALWKCFQRTFRISSVI